MIGRRRRIAGGVALLGAVLATVGGVQAQGPGPGRPGAAPAAEGDGPGPPVLGFAAAGGKWYWLKRMGKEAELREGGPGAPPRSVARGAGWQGLAVAGGSAFVFAHQGERADLVQIPLSGGDPIQVAWNRPRPDGLRAVGDHLWWIEQVPGPDPTLTFIPALAPRLRLCTRPAGGGGPGDAGAPGSGAPASRDQEPPGAVGIAAEWPCEVALPKLDPLEPEILGQVGRDLYLRLRLRLATEFVRVPLAGGQPERIAAEAQDVNGVVAGPAFYWLAPSEEATPASGMRCVRKRVGAATHTVCEWVPPGGRLVARGSEVLYVLDWVYRLPSRLDLPVPVQRLQDWGQGGGGKLGADGGIAVRFDDAGSPIGPL